VCVCMCVYRERGCFPRLPLDLDVHSPSLSPSPSHTNLDLIAWQITPGSLSAEKSPDINKLFSLLLHKMAVYNYAMTRTVHRLKHEKESNDINHSTNEILINRAQFRSLRTKRRERCNTFFNLI